MAILDRLEKNFSDMVKTRKVDTSVISDLKEFKNNLIKSKNQFTCKKNILRFFPNFYAIDTQIRILKKMISRVTIAQQIHDNPKVADDALSVLPQFKLVHDILNSKTKKDSYYIMDISSELQKLAMKNDMYPSSDQITKSVGEKNLEENFNRFVNSVGEELERT